MIVSCPKCGQQLRGDPSSIGTCPKCQTRLQFPEGDSNQGEPITCPHCGQVQRYKDGKCISCGKRLVEENSSKKEKQKKKNGGKISKFKIVAPILVIILIAFTAFIYIKFSNGSGPVSLGMSRNDVTKAIPDYSVDDYTSQTTFNRGAPIFPFLSEMYYRVDFSAKGDEVYLIKAIYNGAEPKAIALYNAMRVLLSIKYGSIDESENSFSSFFTDCWEDDNAKISLHLGIFDSETCVLYVEFLDKKSYEYKTIQDDKYVKWEVPAYPGKLLDSQESYDGAMYVHQGSSSNFDKEETLIQYERTLILNGYELEGDVSDAVFSIYSNGLKTILVLEDKENPENIIVMCQS